MKILCYIHSLEAGGAERVLCTLANDWARRGYDVCVVTLKGASDDFYRLDTRITRALLTNASGKRGALALIDRIRKLRAILKQRQPDVAISMMDTANVVLAFAATGLGSTASIGSERVHPPLSGASASWRILRRFAYGLMYGVVAQTEESANWLRQHTQVRRTWVIPNPISVPMERSQPHREPYQPGAERKWALAVGRLVPQKGFDLLIQAFDRIASTCSNWDLVIVGEGPERARLEEAARSLDLHERVRFVGRVGNVGDWYSAADLFVLPSRFEGFPNALLEALAHGLPAVATNCPTGPRALIRHGIDGLLVPGNDPSALGQAMRQLMTDHELRANFAARAGEAKERFSVDRVSGMWTQAMERRT